MAQVQGGVLFGLSAALYNAITIENGVVQQSNFHDYRQIRMNEVPPFEVIVMPSEESPGGLGEVGTVSAAPALANAIFAATGVRQRSLPINRLRWRSKGKIDVHHRFLHSTETRMMLRQKKWVVAIALGSAAFAGLASVFFWPHRLEPVSTSKALPRGDALIARGRYLATAADCAACHTVPNGRPFAAVRASSSHSEKYTHPI
nr:hypothetical protein [Burkholderia contaminans]